MACRRAFCYCKSYKHSSFQWNKKNNCHSCNHNQKEHGTTEHSTNNSIHRTSSITTSNFAIGNKLEVLYENQWWKAEIIKTKDNQIEITYDEWDEYSNEWINKNSKRLKPIQQQPIIINKNINISSVAALKQKFLNSTASSNNHKYKSHVNIITNRFSNGDCALCAGTNLKNIITLTKCQHTLCKDCMNNYVKITSTDKLNIKCPFCASNIDRYKDIKPALSHREFYDIYLKPNLKKCLSSNCDNTIKLIGTGAARLDCAKCSRSWCVNCNVIWHENMDCDTYKQSNQYVLMEQQFQTFLNENKETIKKCPQCNVDIEKNTGCNHMHCVSCNIHFCWKCLFSAGDGASIYTHMSKCR